MSDRLIDVVHEALTARGWSPAEAEQIIGRVIRHGQQAQEHYPTLPFGKYKGYSIDEVPESYLQWLVTQGWFRYRYDGLYEDVLDIL